MFWKIWDLLKYVVFEAGGTPNWNHIIVEHHGMKRLLARPGGM